MVGDVGDGVMWVMWVEKRTQNKIDQTSIVT